jgi:integrase
LPKFTDRFISSLKPGTKREDVWDAALPSFGIRLAPSGRKTWIVALRRPGNKSSSRVSLGRYPEMSLAEARAKAREEMAAPTSAAEKRTVASVVAEHVERDQKARGRRAWQEVERALQRELAPWFDRPITSITRRDIVVLINGVVDRGSMSMARRLLSHVKRLFTWCVEQSILEASPAATVKPPGDAVSRDRVLSPHELGAVLRACDGLGWPAGEIIRLLALTGQRLNEVAGMAWAEVDTTAALWTIPPGRMKSKRPHEVPLSKPVLEILARLPRVSDRWVFPARTGTGPTKGIRPAKLRLDQLSGVTEWTIHDLRRTCATGMARLGAQPHIISEVLGHARAGVTATVYTVHSYRPEKAQALEAWACALLDTATQYQYKRPLPRGA